MTHRAALTLTPSLALALAAAAALAGACGLTDEPAGGEALASVSSEVQVVHACPGYNSCDVNSTWEPAGAPYCGDVGGACGYECVPAPGRPSYCNSQIDPTPECCSDLVPRQGALQTMQLYYWCTNYAGTDSCRVDLQDTWFVSCGC